jgi:hypothetical protein
MTNKTSQLKNLKEWLSKGYAINTFLAFDKFGITSLHRRLTDLRNAGFPVDRGQWNDPSKRDFKRYKMIISHPFDLFLSNLSEAS